MSRLLVNGKEPEEVILTLINKASGDLYKVELNKVVCNNSTVWTKKTPKIWIAGSDRGLFWSKNGKTWYHCNLDTSMIAGNNQIDDYISFIKNSAGYVEETTDSTGETHLSMEWCVVSEFGAFVSDNGIDWKYWKGGVTNVVYANALFIYNDKGVLRWTPHLNQEGGSCTLSSTGYSFTYACFEPVYENGIWVICTKAHGIYWSTDGKSWNPSDLVSPEGAFPLYDKAVYGNGVWYAFNSVSASYYTSVDGKNWITNQGTAFKARYQNSMWVGCAVDARDKQHSGLYYSNDITRGWSRSNITKDIFTEVAYANGVWIACSAEHDGLYRSTNGTSWKKIENLNVSYQSFNGGVSYSNGKWIACATSYEGNLFYSTDNGLNWTVAKSSFEPFGKMIGGAFNQDMLAQIKTDLRG